MFKQFITFAVGPFLGALISLASIPIITRIISPSDYGVLNLFMSLFSFIYIFISFPDYSFAKEYHAYSKKKLSRYLLWNTTSISLTIGVLLNFLIVIFSKTLAIQIFDDESLYLLFILLGIMLLFATFDRFSQISLRMQGFGLKFSMINIGNKLFVLFFTILFVSVFSKHYAPAILAFGFAQILTSIVSIYFNKSKWSLRDIKLNYGLQWNLFKLSLPMLPSSVIMWGLNSLAIVMLNFYSSHYEIGIYSGAQKIANILTIIQTAFMSFWMPMALKWEYDKVNTKEFTKVNELLLFVMTTIFLIVVLFKEVFILLLGSEFSTAIYLVPLTLFFPIMYTLSEAIGVGFALKGKVIYNLIASGISLIFFVLIGIILIPRLGGIGAAISTAMSYTLLFWIKTIVAKRVWYDFNIRNYLFSTILLVMISIINLELNISRGSIYILNTIFLLTYLLVNKKYLILLYRELTNFISKKVKKT